MEIRQLLNLAKQTAKDLGFHIRQDLLNGQQGGMCEFGGKRWIILDVSHLSNRIDCADPLDLSANESKFAIIGADTADFLRTLEGGPFRSLQC